MDYISKEDFELQTKKLIILLNETEDQNRKKVIEQELKRLRDLRFESKIVDRLKKMEDRKRR